MQLRQTEDILMRNMLAGTAGFINCTGGDNGDVPTEITLFDVQNIVATLLGNNAYTVLDNIEGEDRFGTAPVRDAYFALCHTDMTRDLENVSSFIHKNQYPAMNSIRSEWGSIGNLRFLISSIGSMIMNASNLGNTVYNIFCVGIEAYADVEQNEYSAQFIYRPAIYNDQLAQNASVGWKTANCPRILNDAWVLAQRATLSV